MVGWIASALNVRFSIGSVSAFQMASFFAWDHPAMCPMVLPLPAQLPGSGRASPRTRTRCGPFNDLSLGPSLQPRTGSLLLARIHDTPTHAANWSDSEQGAIALLLETLVE